MEVDERDRIESLVTGNAELRSLWEEHQELERRLDEMNSRSHLSPSEQEARKLLKKRKLAGKDRIAQILAASVA